MRAAALTALAATALGMKDGQVYRKLGSQESMMHVMHEKSRPFGMGAVTYTLVVDCQRRLEARHVQMALEALRRQLPILRARVEERKDGRFMVASNARMSLTELPPGGDWLTHHVDKSNNEQLYNSPNGPHWKAAFMPDPRNTMTPSKLPHRAVLYLTMAHTFTDGVTQGRLFGQLLRNLDQAVQKGRVEESSPTPVYPCSDDMLEKVPFSGSVAKMLLQGLGLMFRDRKSALVKAYVSDYDGRPLGDNPCRMASASLEPEKLRRLHSKCREHGVTINAAISAAVSIAGARMIAKTPDGQENPGPYVLRTSFMVNTRRYLPPEVDMSQLYGCCVGLAASHIEVPSTSSDNFWPVASNIHASLQRQINMRMPVFLNQRLLPLVFKPDKWEMEQEMKRALKLKLHPADYNINNIGNLDAVFPKTEAVVPVELHRTLRQHPAFDQSFGCQLFQTVGGRLFYDLNYVTDHVQPEHAERFQLLVMEVLREMVDRKD